MGKGCSKDALAAARQRFESGSGTGLGGSAGGCEDALMLPLPVNRRSKPATRTVNSAVPAQQPCSGASSTYTPGSPQRQNSNGGGHLPPLSDQSFTAPEVLPPHSVVRENIHNLSKTHRFYVHIHSLKARGLRVGGDPSNSGIGRSSGSKGQRGTDDIRDSSPLAPPTSGVYCIVNWDDFAFERRTRPVPPSMEPRWDERIQFYWSVPSLGAIKDRRLEIKVFEKARSKPLGVVKVDLLTIATGPVHHDLRLLDPKTGRPGGDKGRLIFDVRMAQVCQLIIGPVEILVHLHESLDALDQMEVEGVGTQRPPQALKNEADRDEDEGATPTVNGNGSLQSSELSQLPGLNGTDAGSEPATVTRGKPQTRFGNETTRIGVEQARVVSAPTLALKEQITSDEETGGIQAITTRSSASQLPALDNGDEEEDDVVASRLERSATGGHAESDAFDPLLAEWQLTFSPTGVDNPSEYCSCWTGLCDQPYWNAVDHTVVDQLTHQEGLYPSLLLRQPSVHRQDSAPGEPSNAVDSNTRRLLPAQEDAALDALASGNRPAAVNRSASQKVIKVSSTFGRAGSPHHHVCETENAHGEDHFEHSSDHSDVPAVCLDSNTQQRSQTEFVDLPNLQGDGGRSPMNPPSLRTIPISVMTDQAKSPQAQRRPVFGGLLEEEICVKHMRSLETYNAGAATSSNSLIESGSGAWGIISDNAENLLIPRISSGQSSYNASLGSGSDGRNASCSRVFRARSFLAGLRRCQGSGDSPTSPIERASDVGQVTFPTAGAKEEESKERKESDASDGGSTFFAGVIGFQLPERLKRDAARRQNLQFGSGLVESTARRNSIGKDLRHTGSAPSLTSSMSAYLAQTPHLDHIDPQLTYQKLAAVCRKGRLVRDMLYNDLPTIQLESTSDFLRQNHLKLRLYAKRLGVATPKFYGESWLPFFKIYDADVVEQMHQNFCDSHFREKLWFEGKCIGHIEGVIVFQNNPMVRQMLAGVHTDQGIMRISPPVLDQLEFCSASQKSGLKGAETVPDEIKRLSQYHRNLLDILFSKTRHSGGGANAYVAGPGAAGPASNKSVSTRITSLLRARFNKQGARDSTDLLTVQQHFTATAAEQHKKAGGGPIEFQGSHLELHSVCDQVLQTLRASHAETRRSFIYETASALLLGQRVLLDLAHHCLEFADYVPWQYRSTYSAILHQTLRRGELDLGSVLPPPASVMENLTWTERRELCIAVKLRRVGEGLSAGDAEEDDSTSLPGGQYGLHRTAGGRISRPIERKAASLTADEEESVIVFHRRMLFCRGYWLFLHSLMCYCVTKICGDCVFEGQRRYLSIFLCIIYFRLPEFRRELLQGIISPEEREAEIPEWRGTEFELDVKTLAHSEEWHPQCPHKLALDWGPLYDQLKDYFGEETLAASLHSTTLTLPSDWKETLASRGVAFFSLLEHWAKHVYQSIADKQSLQWHFLPGYPSLLKAMLLEMRGRDVTKYPDALLNCSGALLANEKLLSVFIKVVFLKSSVYNSAAVFAALNYVDYWVQVLSMRNQLLPPNFDVAFLRKGLDIVLGSDIGLNIAKALWFIYKNISTFKGSQLKIFLLDLLFNRYFFTLLLNWSWLVRKCFIWFLLYRVSETTRLVLTRDPEIIKAVTPGTKSENNSESPGSGTAAGSSSLPTVLSAEEIVFLWAYVELSNVLSILRGPSVFPKHLTAQRLPELLRSAVAPADQEDSNSFFPHTQYYKEHALTPSNGDENDSLSRASQTPTASSPGPRLNLQGSRLQSLHPTSQTSTATPTATLPRPSMSPANSVPTSQAPWRRHMLQRIALLTEAETMADLEARAAFTNIVVPDRCQVYTKAALTEFTTVRSPPFAFSALDISIKDFQTLLYCVYPTLTFAIGRQYESPRSRHYSKSLVLYVEISLELIYRLVRFFRSHFGTCLQELQLYRTWLTSGAETLPTMNIPASPLDSNVDVPLDNW